MPPRSTNAPYSVMFLMTPVTTMPSSRFSQGARLELVALLLEEHAAREHDVAALLVELDDLELVGLADQLVEVADRAEVHLRAGQECLHAAADGDAEAALDARGDGALDQLVALASGADLVPNLELVGLLLGEHDEAVVVLLGLDEHVDGVADLDRELSAGAGELVHRDDAFGLVADVDDYRVFVELDDGASDDVTVLERVGLRNGGLEKSGKAARGSCARLGALRLRGCGHV